MFELFEIPTWVFGLGAYFFALFLIIRAKINQKDWSEERRDD